MNTKKPTGQTGHQKYRTVPAGFVLLLIITGFFSIAANTTSAAAYYVDAVNGNDSYTGLDTSHAWKTAAKAGNTAVAGDTVLFMPGTYTNQLAPVNSGTSTAKITFKAQTTRTAIISPSSNVHAVNIQGKSYIRIEGFEIRNIPADGWGIQAGSSHYIEIIGNYIHDIGGQNEGGIYTNSSATYTTIQNNEIYNIYNQGVNLTGNYLTFNGNHIHYTAGHGFTGNGDHLIITNNIIENCSYLAGGHTNCINVEGSISNSTIANNILSDYDHGIFFPLDDCAGWYVKDVQIYGNIIYNNLKYNGSFGGGMKGIAGGASTTTGHEVSNLTIHSNTFGWLATDWPPIYLEMSATAGTVSGYIKIYNNIIWGHPGVDAIHADSKYLPYLTSNYNFIYKSTKSSFEGTNSKVGQNPKFVDFQEHSSHNNFHLDPNSPTINAGDPNLAYHVNPPSPFSDRDGISRPINGFDMGAYEYVPTDLSFPPIGNKEVNEDSTLTFTVDVNDPNVKPFIEDHNLPSEPNFINNIFSWTPTYNDAGSYEATFVVQNDLFEDFENIIITVNNVNRSPVLAAISDKSVNENDLLSFLLSATDLDGDAITYSAENLPSGALLVRQIFNWTPNYDQAGTYQVKFTATDGQAQNSQMTNLIVNNVNRSPVLTAINDKLVDEGSLLSFQVNATDADSDTITYSAENLPSGATLVGQTFNWTPNYDQAGTYQVKFTAIDGQAQVSQTVNITVNDTAAFLLNENFDNGTYAGWSIIDEGAKARPSLWSAASGTMVQKSNIYTLSFPSQPGTYALYNAGTVWTNYKVSLTMKSNDSDSIGVMFRYKDKNNYYRFSWDRNRKQQQLVKKCNGRFTVLCTNSGIPYVKGRDYQVDIVANGTTLQVFIDSVLVLQTTDISLNSGSIAIYSWANAGSYFDNIVVQKL